MKPHVPGRWAAQRLGTGPGPWVAGVVAPRPSCTVRMEVTCTPRVTRRLSTAMEAEAEAFGRFIDRTAEVRIVP